MPTVLVTGANRGLGYEHVKQYAQKGWQIIACARDPEKAVELQELKNEFHSFEVLVILIYVSLS